MAFMPWLLAKAAIDASGCWQAATNPALNWRVYVRWVRRVEYLVVSGSLSMVCTMGCVHTILRDGRDQFKMGSPGAYHPPEWDQFTGCVPVSGGAICGGSDAFAGTIDKCSGWLKPITV